LLAISSNPPTNLDEPIAKRHIFVLQKSLEILKRPNTFYGQTVFLPNFSYNLKKIYRFTQKYNNQKTFLRSLQWYTTLTYQLRDLNNFNLIGTKIKIIIK
jgi:hypothetical protein